MTQPQIQQLLDKQRTYFMSGVTKDIGFRIAQLKRLKEGILAREDDIIQAIKHDLNKPELETYTTEIMGALEEIKLSVKRLRSWAAPKKVSTPMSLFRATSRIYSEPYGVVLIITAWNYPFQLAFHTLIGAIAAGNCVLIKPSELSLNSSKLIATIIDECFEQEFCAVIEGGVEETSALLRERFDFIHFTGSPRIGKIIAQAAANHLTPVVLELGGKSPCIVDSTADIDITARRIVWGKFMNAGQTCIAPDYLFAHKAIKDKLLAAIFREIQTFYGDLPEDSPDYCRIINNKHFERLSKLLTKGKILIGGKTRKADRYIAPTVIDNITWEDPVMQEEIFGPILPILEYEELSEVIAMVNAHEKPLALYFFSTDKKDQQRIIRETSSGGGCINATIMHTANPHLPFGGVGNSGMGNYHGKASFDTFSHQKSILRKAFRPDLNLIYPPYRNKLKLLKRLF